jgi:DnaJ like chaperone protein
MSLTFVFALLGLLVGGFRGLLVGAAVGYVAGLMLRKFLHDRLRAVQDQFLESTFAVMGALCKADGIVTRDEIAAAEAMFDKLRLSSEQREIAKASFNRGKAQDFDVDAEVAKFARAAHGYRPLLIMFLQVQCAAIASDGRIHPAEHQLLVRIARDLGLSEFDLAQLEALLRASAGGGAHAGAGAAPSKSSLDDAYAALGLTPDASDAEIKKTYRRLMSQNHPDKLAGKGLPESMRQMAEERTREISTAYAILKEARGFT